MSMDHASAERWVTISAATVAGMYAYRRLVEGSGGTATANNLIGASKPPAPLGAWATAWGFTFVVVAIMAEASPPLGGSFAILIMVAAILTNASNLFSDVGKEQKGATSSPTATATAAAAQPSSSSTAAKQTAGNASTGGFTT